MAKKKAKKKAAKAFSRTKGEARAVNKAMRGAQAQTERITGIRQG